MIRRLLAICIVCFMAMGCTQRIHPAFYDVVKSHRALLDETNNAVIGSIEADLDASRSILTDDQVRSIEKLIERLHFLKLQGLVIEEYVESEFVDEDLIAELIRYRWIEQE